jgi:hypothetical protein
MNRNLLTANNASKTCRICFDTDNQTGLIRPCLCSGGSAYVHRECLDDWRSMNKEGRGFKYCEICHFQFVIEPVVDDYGADRKRKLIFRLLVTRDITLVILLVQAVIIGLAFLILACDSKTGALRKEFPASMSPFGVYYVTSLIIFLALLGFFGLIGLCCGWIDMSERNRVYDDDPCNCNSMQCFYCFYACNNCDHGGGGGDCNCDCKGGSGEGIIAVVVIVVVIFAIIGVFIGIIITVMIVENIIKRHSRKLWLKQQTKKYIVKDFEGKLDQLKSMSTARPATVSSVYNTMNSNTDLIKPSAPVEVLSKDTIKYTTE